MPNINTLSYGLISILLTLCAIFVFIDNDHRALALAKHKAPSPHVMICKSWTPWITVLSETQFKYHRQTFDLAGLVAHIQNEFYEYPFSAVGIHAQEKIPSGVITQLTGDLKQAIPDSQIIWSYYR